MSTSPERGSAVSAASEASEARTTTNEERASLRELDRA